MQNAKEFESPSVQHERQAGSRNRNGNGDRNGRKGRGGDLFTRVVYKYATWVGETRPDRAARRSKSQKLYANHE